MKGFRRTSIILIALILAPLSQLNAEKVNAEKADYAIQPGDTFYDLDTNDVVTVEEVKPLDPGTGEVTHFNVKFDNSDEPITFPGGVVINGSDRLIEPKEDDPLLGKRILGKDGRVRTVENVFENGKVEYKRTSYHSVLDFEMETKFKGKFLGLEYAFWSTKKAGKDQVVADKDFILGHEIDCYNQKYCKGRVLKPVSKLGKELCTYLEAYNSCNMKITGVFEGGYIMLERVDDQENDIYLIQDNFYLQEHFIFVEPEKESSSNTPADFMRARR